MGILTNSCYLCYSPAGESSDDELALTPVMAVSLADPAPEAIVRPEGMATHLANSYMVHYENFSTQLCSQTTIVVQ